MNRIKTYIEGFDELVDGGFPQGSTVLVSGAPGTGKTIFAIEYLYNGAKNGEVGIYFTFEEKKESIIEQAAQFGFDLKSLEKKKKLKIISIGTDDISKDSIGEIFEIIDTLKATRVVIDSITTLSYLTPQPSDNVGVSPNTIKTFLYSFITRFKSNPKLTSLFVSQKDEIDSDLISQYLCDGVITIDYESLGGDFSRHLVVRKLRKTKNNEDIHPLEINSKKGIVVHDLE